MKRKIKEIGSMILVMAMIMTAFGSYSFAAGTLPTAADKADITVTDVESGATVTGYQIVVPEYTAAGLKGYKAVDGIAIADITNPTAAEITKIAKDIIDNAVTLTPVTFEEKTGYYTSNVGAGSYLILVTDSETAKIYNPMVLSAGYDKDNILRAGTVSANEIYGQTGYPKSALPSIDKSIVDPDSGNTSGDDVAIGDTVNFKISTKVPAYSNAYQHATFTITDELSTGFDSYKDVTVEGASDTDYKKTIEGNKMKIEFTSDFILANGNKDIVVTYSSTLNDKAGINYDANTNKVKLDYTNDPKETATSGPKTGSTEDKTYHYTFGIDASLMASKTEYNKETHELIKVDENGSVTTKTVNEGIDELTTTGALEGAIFELLDKDGNSLATSTTNANGYMSFTGLDAGTYTLQETAAPSGYTVNTTTHTVVISAEYNKDGTLKSYSIAIDGKNTSTYTATYDGGTITKIVADEAITVIKNTKIGALPSTGGIGTVVFSVAGAVIMAIAAGLIIFRRRKVTE